MQAESLSQVDFEIYTRDGFQSEWTNKVWNSENAQPINIPKDQILSIPLNDNKESLILFSRDKIPNEKTIQIQIPIKKLESFKTPGLLISRIGENWEIYQNERLLDYKIDIIDSRIIKEQTTVNRIIPLDINSSIDNKCLMNIRIIGNPDSPRSILQLDSSLALSEVSDLQYRSIEILPFLLISLFAFLGFYLIYLYVRMKKYIHVLYFGMFLFAYAVFTLMQSNYIFSVINDTNKIYQFSTISLAVSYIFIIFFLDSFFIYRITNYTKFSVIAAIVFCLTVIFFSKNFLYFMEWFTFLETGNLILYISLGYKIAKKDIRRRKFSNEKYPFLKFLFKNRIGILLLNIIFLACAIYIETFLNLFLNIKTPIVILASLGFFLFMTLYIVQKMEKAFISQEKVKMSHLEEKKRLKLEQEISIQNERQKAFIDIHDEIGVDLSFLGIRISKYIENKIIPVAQGTELSDFVVRISKGIRYRLQLLEDEKYLKEDFLFAVRLLLIRKYEYVNRIIDFSTNINENLRNSLRDKNIESLYKIIREIANNDAKYGMGVSRWEFNQTEKTFEMKFIASTAYKFDNEGKGYGWKNILSLVKQLDGTILNQINGDQYNVHLTLPLR